ncbi:alpha/beta fold hydrolase [Cupriavidus basilensis]|uniref:Alpha/beta fold hydrolase n=1 Tax=Cupriavidus basilensis TaxID=68895 RepID=A0ABT6ARF6_9BURK|nr:alpha/beta fold hydrolase [Cupriavidus basilensis]MDF3835180.1 alpha/beta fold hydrolase [Cupriavidus basilensis]
MQRLTIGSEGIRTSLIEAGTGRPTILVHGTSSSAESNWAALLPGLAQHRRCLALDLRGSGETHDDGAPLTLETLVEQVRACMDLAPDQQADLVGYSLGGVVAAAAAALMPERVRRLAVFGAWAQTDRRMRLLFSLWQSLALSDHHQLARMILLNGVSEPYLARLDDATADAILARFGSGLAPGSDRQAALDATIDIAPLLPRIRAATLVIGLRHDRMVPPAHCRALAEAIGQARYAEIDSGHLVMLEQPERLLELISRHLD